MRSLCGIVMSTLVLLSLAAGAGEAIQLSDINTGFAGANSNPQNFAESNGKCFFSATDGTNGVELYVSDGFSSGTVLVRDIFSGPGSSFPSSLTDLSGVLYFTANDGSTGAELWKSDGTAAGTVQVKDIRLGPGGSNPLSLTVVGGVLYFTADDGVSGRELWKSDGTTAGTVQVKDINTSAAGSGLSASSRLTVQGTTLLFPANDGTNGTELWRSDGTDAGTVLVNNINTAAGGSALSVSNEILVIGTDAYFPATNSASDRELYRVTSANVVSLISLSGTVSSNPGNLTAVAGNLYCTATQAASDTELFRVIGTTPTLISLNNAGSSTPSNLIAVNGMLYCRATFNLGTAFGTEVVQVNGTTPTCININNTPASGSSFPTNFTAVGTTLLVSATDGVNGTELFTITGTTATLTNINNTSATASSFPSGFKAFDATRAVFVATNGNNGVEPYLWNAGAVSQIRDINPGADNSFPQGATLVNLTVGGPTFFFSANDGFGTELFKSDTTGSGTLRVKDLNTSANSSEPADLTDFNGTLFFSANEATQGFELYKSNGTPAGTLLANDIIAGAASSSPSDLKKFGNTIVFAARDATNGRELQKSDGTTVSIAANIEAGTNDSFPLTLMPSATALYFKAFTTAAGDFRMFVFDGATATEATEGTTPPFTYFSPSFIRVAGSNVFFVAGTFDNTMTFQGEELWQITGTTASMVKDINTTTGFSGAPQNLMAMGSTLFFSADDGTNGRELWKSDGTANGTVRVKDIIVGTGGSDPANFTVVGSTLYFTANDGVNGTELWKTDGTDAGTVLVKDIFPGMVGSNPHSLTNLNGTLLFAAADGVNGFELWKSDGSAAGTTLVKDINPGAGSSMPPINLIVPILPAGGAGRAVFAASNGVSGTELWKTNGTADGTAQIQDINPGGSSSTPDQFTVSGNFVYFTANNGANGKELWALALSALLDPPAITTLPVAVGAAGTAFNFQIGLTGTEPITVTSTDLPPGLVLSGSSISGVPTTPGTYMVSITVTNSSGTASQGLKIIITGDGVSNSIVDTDSDGFADEIEVALGLDPKNGAATPFNGMPAGTTIPLNVQKLTIALDFVKTQKDQISFNGLIGLPVGFTAAGQSVTASIGGAIKTFSLDAKGQLSPKSKTESFKLSFIAGSTTEQLGKYSLKFSKGTFGTFFADEGLTSVTVKEALKSVSVTLLFNGRLYQAPVTQLYTATAGKKGKTAQPSDGGGNLFPTR